jgi:hypothetical protein
MKKYFVVAIAVLALVAVAMPASAKVEFSYGGLFRARILSQSDFTREPTFSATTDAANVGQQVRDNDENTRNRLDQRLRLYFTFTASENLKLVTKFEAQSVWGSTTAGNNFGQPYNTGSSSGRVGADGNDFVVKNSYIDFNIPNSMVPINAKVGIQGINLINSWVVDDDFSTANVTFKFDALKVMLGYIGGQNQDTFNEKDNIDDWYLVFDYVCGPWSAQLVGFYQSANDTFASADPSTQTGGPVNVVVGNRIPTSGSFTSFDSRNFFQRYLGNVDNADHARVYDNNLFDLAFNVNYKVDWLSAYINFVKNFGSIDAAVYSTSVEKGVRFSRSMDYTGWMIDAGVNYFCGPFTFNVGGFYTTGPQDIAASLGSRGAGTGAHTGDIDWFVYPVDTTKYFSEIIGHGILDAYSPQHEDFQWRGAPAPSNLWTVNLGAAWQLLPSTKASFSYWYFGTSEDVVSGPKRAGAWINQNDFLTNYFAGTIGRGDVNFASDIGHEFNLGITHKIVDGLVLDLVGAYLIAGDAYSMRNDDLDAMELGARLQWTF